MQIHILDLDANLTDVSLGTIINWSNAILMSTGDRSSIKILLIPSAKSSVCHNYLHRCACVNLLFMLISESPSTILIIKFWKCWQTLFVRIKLMVRIRGKKGQCQSQRRITVKAITVTDVFIQCIISYEKSLQTFTKFYFNHHSHWHEKRNEQQ